MPAAHVYHWKHGWIPLDHTAALSKAKGNHKLAATYIAAVPEARGIHTRQDVAKATLDLPNIPNHADRAAATAETAHAARGIGATDLLPTPMRTRPIAGRDLADVADDDLAGLLTEAATHGDAHDIDHVVAELDRRDAAVHAERAAAARRAAAKTRRDARTEADHARRDAHFDDLIASGDDPEQAYATAFGVTVERQRREQAISSLRDNGYTGAGFDQLTAAAYQDEVDRLYIAAENGTRGAMLTQEGRRKGVNPRTLFTGNEATARRYASEELKQFWDQHGRLTLTDMRASLLGGTMRQRTVGDSWHQ